MQVVGKLTRFLVVYHVLMVSATPVFALLRKPTTSLQDASSSETEQLLLATTSESLKHHKCPSDVATKLEIGKCSFPLKRSNRHRTSCTVTAPIQHTDGYCLTAAADVKHIYCERTEESKMVTCRCHFEELNLETRFCHLYKYKRDSAMPRDKTMQ